MSYRAAKAYKTMAGRSLCYFFAWSIGMDQINLDCQAGKKNGHLSDRKTKDKENPGMKTKTWLNPFAKLEA
jgi:hypothetical protein